MVIGKYHRGSPQLYARSGVKMHSLNSKCTEMCSLIENALLDLLNVPLNCLNKHSLSNCLYVYSDVGCVISSFYTLNTICGMWLAQVGGTQCVKMCSLKNPGDNPAVIISRNGYFQVCFRIFVKILSISAC